MKKIICILVGAAFAIAIYWLGFANGVYYNEATAETAGETIVLSDEEDLNKYIEDRYGVGCYGVVFSTNDKYIYYNVYTEDGDLLNSPCVVHKSWL